MLQQSRLVACMTATVLLGCSGSSPHSLLLLQTAGLDESILDMLTCESSGPRSPTALFRRAQHCQGFTSVGDVEIWLDAHRAVDYVSRQWGIRQVSIAHTTRDSIVMSFDALADAVRCGDRETERSVTVMWKLPSYRLGLTFITATPDFGIVIQITTGGFGGCGDSNEPVSNREHS